MNDSDKINVVKKLGGWERLIIFSGVVLTVPLFALLATAIYALVTGRVDAHLGILLSVVAILVLWAFVWGMLWIVSGLREGSFGNNMGDTNSPAYLDALRKENEKLRNQLEELSKK